MYNSSPKSSKSWRKSTSQQIEDSAIENREMQSEEMSGKQQYLDSPACPICLLEVKNPICTDCGHTFCTECLEKFKGHLSDGCLNACPVCRKDGNHKAGDHVLSRSSNVGNRTSDSYLKTDGDDLSDGPALLKESEHMDKESNPEKKKQDKQVSQESEASGKCPEKQSGESEQLLLCPLCLEIFDNATLLHCGHTFCFTCLKQYDNLSLDHLICPLCRQVTKLQENRLESLLPNIIVNALADDIRQPTHVKDRMPQPTVKEGNLGMVNSTTDGMNKDCDHDEQHPGKASQEDDPAAVAMEIKGRTKYKDTATGLSKRATSFEGLPLTNDYRSEEFGGVKDDSREQGHVSTVSTQDESEKSNPIKMSYLYHRAYPIPQINCHIEITAIPLLDYCAGMASIKKNTVSIAYGNIKGCDTFKLVRSDRARRQRLKTEKIAIYKEQFLSHSEGTMHDIAVLPDGRRVVSKGYDKIQVYSPDGHPTDTEFKSGSSTWYNRLCTDNKGNIYTVNGTQVVHIFNVDSKEERRISLNLSQDHPGPRQICVTSDGKIVTTTCHMEPSRIVLYSNEGNLLDSLTCDVKGQHFYTAIDDHDSLFVAKVNRGRGRLTLSVHNLRDGQLTFRKKIGRIKLKWLGYLEWCYMVCLPAGTHSTLIAFANSDYLYFIQIHIHTLQLTMNSTNPIGRPT